MGLGCVEMSGPFYGKGSTVHTAYSVRGGTPKNLTL